MPSWSHAERHVGEVADSDDSEEDEAGHVAIGINARAAPGMEAAMNPSPVKLMVL